MRDQPQIVGLSVSDSCFTVTMAVIPEVLGHRTGCVLTSRPGLMEQWDLPVIREGHCDGRPGQGLAQGWLQGLINIVVALVFLVGVPALAAWMIWSESPRPEAVRRRQGHPAEG